MYGQGRLFELDGGIRTWYGADALGSTRRTLNSAGNALSSQWYDPWGLPRSPLATPFGFTGERQDSTGDTYLRAREYLAQHGVFGSVDPFEGFPEQPYSLHPYQYAYANPVLWTDPSGKLAIFVTGGFRRDDPNNYTDNGIIDMAFEFASIIPGTTYVANVYQQTQIENKIVEVHRKTCGAEPIILVGQSRGAATVVLALRTLELDYEDIQIDLVVTLGIVPFRQKPDTGGIYEEKRSNVIRHINIRSEKRFADLIGFPAIPERMVIGSEENVIIGTTHTTLDDEEITIDGMRYQNPAWGIIEEAIEDVSLAR